jgi:hypothetical protein
MALNLIRNSRVFFTTNVNSEGVVAASGFTADNTREIQVLDGFSFSQNTTTESVTISEAGDAPVRGQRSFNTALDPVDWSISTYIRPRLFEGATVTAGPDADDFVDCEESVLWNALSSSKAIGVSGAGWTVTPGVSPVSTVAFAGSNVHQLQSFGLIIVFEAVTYVVDNCALESATIDFGLDAIATIAWAGRGTKMRQLASPVVINNSTGALTGGLTGTTKLKDTTAKYLANKLSTMSITRTNGFAGQTSKVYTVALTGGNLTIANNLTYLTPANLGTVNIPVTYFTGTRAITASVNAYLKTGSTETAALLDDLLASSQNSENQFAVTVNIGGNSSSATRVVLDMPYTMLAIPTVSSEQVISTTINMTPQAGSTSAYDIEGTNELSVKYYSAA